MSSAIFKPYQPEAGGRGKTIIKGEKWEEGGILAYLISENHEKVEYSCENPPKNLIGIKNMCCRNSM